MNDKKTPAFKSRVGNVEVATWANEKDGRSFYGSTTSVRYRDKNGEFQDGSSYGTQELLCLIACAVDVLGQQFAARRSTE